METSSGGDRAYYSPSGDYIQMPPFAQFKSAEKCVSVLCHELSPSSGAKSRVNRDLTGRFGDVSYAMEEMVAQISASFLCADCRAIFTAASKAEEAANYLKHLAELAQKHAS